MLLVGKESGQSLQDTEKTSLNFFLLAFSAAQACEEADVVTGPRPLGQL